MRVRPSTTYTTIPNTFFQYTIDTPLWGATCPYPISRPSEEAIFEYTWHDVRKDYLPSCHVNGNVSLEDSIEGLIGRMNGYVFPSGIGENVPVANSKAAGTLCLLSIDLDPRFDSRGYRTFDVRYTMKWKKNTFYKMPGRDGTEWKYFPVNTTGQTSNSPSVLFTPNLWPIPGGDFRKLFRPVPVGVAVPATPN